MTIPMESKSWTGLELPDCKTMLLLWKAVRFSLTQFKHGSTETLQVLKEDVVFRLETRAEKLKAKSNVFLLSEPKIKIRRAPLSSNYANTHSKMPCADTGYWTETSPDSPLLGLLEVGSCFDLGIFNNWSSICRSTFRYILRSCIVYT